MRINSSSESNKQPEQQTNKTNNARPVVQHNEPPDGVNVTHTGSQNFASILERVGKPKDKERDKDFKESDTTRSRETKSKEETEETEEIIQTIAEEKEEETKRDSHSSNDGGGGFGQMSGGVRETFIASSDTINARAILHIADLERIVSVIRTKIQTGQQREVLIELKNSVLDGLKIRLTATVEGNRVSAEFIAATERVKTQLDARLSDLSDLLRSRGVALDRLKTSLSSDQSNDERSNSSDRSAVAEGRSIGERHNQERAALQDENAITIEEETSAGKTYRA